MMLRNMERNLSRLRYTSGLALVLAVTLPLAGANAVQLNAVYNDGGADNDWNTAANWDINQVPDNNITDTFIAIINGGFNVDLDIEANVDGLTIGAGDNLDIQNNQDLLIDNGGTVQNDGAIDFESIGNLTRMEFNAGGNINGAGQFNFTNNANNAVRTGAGTTITQGVGHTFEGAFTLLNNNGSFVNNGTINSTLSGQVTIDPEDAGTFTNNGTMNATGTGGFRFNEATYNNNTQIDIGNGSRLDVKQDAKIIGGVINTTGTGVVNVDGTTGLGAQFENVTVNGNLRQNNSEDGTVTGTFNLDGTWEMNSIGTATVLNVNGGVTLDGNGTIDMSNNTQNRIVSDGADITIGNNFTIVGAGQLGLNNSGLINNGTIQNDQANSLTIDPSAGGTGFVNNGTLELLGAGDINIGNGDTQNNGTVNVTGTGRLDIGTGTFTNTGQTVTLDNGGDLEVSQGTVFEGGTIQSNTAGSEVRVEGTSGAGSTFSNVQINSDLVQNNSFDATVTGTTDVNGDWALNSIGTATVVNLNDGATLNGNGKFIGSNNTQNRIVTNDTVVTFGANFGFEGAGQILLNTGGMINNGDITANQANPIIIDPNAKGFVNNGTINANGSGGIDLNAGTYTNNGSINVADGSRVDLAQDTIINGGNLTTAGTGKFHINSASLPGVQLNGVTIDGDVQQNNSRDATVTGPFTLNGNWDMNSIGTATVLSFEGGVTVNGNANINWSNNIQNRIVTDDTVMTLGANAKVQGAGQLLVNSGGMINNGTIISDQSNSLTVDPNGKGFVNNATMQATGTGGFIFGAGTFTNNSTIDIADTSRLNVGNGTNVDGGVINTTGSGVVNLFGSDGVGSTFNDVTVNGDLNQNNSDDSTFTGTFTHNNGVFAVNSIGTETNVLFNGGATIQGNGVMQLTSNANNEVKTDGTTLTVGAGYTIEGGGKILDNTGSMILNGTLRGNTAADMVVNPGVAQTFTNQGTVEATNGGTVAFQSFADVTNVTGGGTQLNGGRWAAFAGSEIDLFGANITTNNADVTLSGVGSTFDQINNIDTNGAAGSFNILADRVFNTVGNLDNAGNVLVDGVGSQLNAAGVFTQTAGQTTLNNGGTLASNGGAAQFTGGVVNGSGNITGGAQFTGTSVIDTGASPGIINITGDTLFDAIMNVEIEGIAVDGALADIAEINTASDPLTTEFDQVNVFTGTANLGNSLVINVAKNVLLDANVFFDILTADVITGNLGNVTINMPADFSASIVSLFDSSTGTNRQALRLTHNGPSEVPVPAGMAMLAPALLGGAWLARRKAKKS